MRQLILIVAALGSFSPATVAADWPQWRGPQRTGISAESGLLERWPEQGPKLVWQVNDIGNGYATPAVAGSRIFVLSSREMDNEFIQALSVEDGRQLWSTRLGSVGNADQRPSFPMARSTPTVDGDRLYALSSDGDLACLQAATGEVLWRKSLRNDFGGQPGNWAYAESPLVDGEVLVVTPGGADATLVALDKRTGATIWKSAVPGGDKAAYCSVFAAEIAGRKQYIQFLDEGVVGVDANSGEFLWRYDGTSKGPANISMPTAYGDYVYSTNSRRFGGALVKLSAGSDGISVEELYFKRSVPNTLGGQVLIDGYLYGTNSQGLVAAELLTGEIMWQTESGPGATLFADGNLYIHLESGDVALVEATPDACRERGRFTPPNQPNHSRPREVAWTYPVLANGRLYVRDLGTLWCYDVSARK